MFRSVHRSRFRIGVFDILIQNVNLYRLHYDYFLFIYLLFSNWIFGSKIIKHGGQQREKICYTLHLYLNFGTQVIDMIQYTMTNYVQYKITFQEESKFVKPIMQDPKKNPFSPTFKHCDLALYVVKVSKMIFMYSHISLVHFFVVEY